jgi:hypothetical protein
MPSHATAAQGASAKAPALLVHQTCTNGAKNSVAESSTAASAGIRSWRRSRAHPLRKAMAMNMKKNE